LTMLNTASIKKGYHKAGKSFVLLFNRVSMYGPGHPFSVQSVEEFYQSIIELLKTTSPVVMIYARDQFFLEDEPLDRNLNYFKMSLHFKKAQVSSISIEKELQKREVEDFVKIFLDTRRYPSAEQMRSAAAALRVNHIKINHIFYQKVTEDDQVVAKSVAEKSERLSGELDSSRHYQEALGMIAGKLLMEDLDQNLSLKSLIADPAGFAHGLVAGGLSAGPGQGPSDGPSGQPYSITGRLSALSSDIKQGLCGGASVALSELAEALVKMKRDLLSEIEAQKSLGILLDRDGEALDQAEDITDAVILELVRKEYDHGKTPVERLAFVLQRIVPLPEDFKRLLPRIRDCLVAEGMPLADFSKLIKQLGVDRQTEGLIQAIHQGAEDIGVDGSDLLGRLKSDPTGFARFLYLASEIEKESGSSKPLCDILVDHLERLGPKLVNRGGGPGQAASDEKLRDLVLHFNAKVVDGLRGGLVDAWVVDEVEQRLKARLEASVQAIRAELTGYQGFLEATDHRTLLQNLEDGLAEEHELKRVLGQVRADFKEQGLDENDLSKIFERIEAVKKNNRNAEKMVDDIVFSQKHTRTLLEIEIARAVRYGTDLSGIAFSIFKTASPPPGDCGEVSSVDATTEILERLRDKLRNTDWIGVLSNKLFMAVLPMTTPKEAHLASRRLLKALNAVPISISGRPVLVKVAGSVIHYDRKLMPDTEALIRYAQNEHMEMAHRLRNLQDFM
jgi:hypothetical protein